MTKKALLIACLSVLLLAADILISWNSVEKILESKELLAKQYRYLDERGATGHFVQNEKKQYDQIAPNVPLLDGLTIEHGHELSFVTNLENLASTQGITEALQLDSAHVANRNGIPALPFTIAAHGPYPAVITFLGSLRTQPTVVTITTIRLGRGVIDAKTNQPGVDGVISGFVYVNN